MPSISSANAVMTMTIQSLYPTPFQLQGFSAEDIFTVEPLGAAEVMMGIDGVQSGGFVYVPVKQRIHLQADSPTNKVFETWWAQQQVIGDLYFAQGTVVYKSIARKYALTNGILETHPPISDAAKTLRPRLYTVSWERILPANI